MIKKLTLNIICLGVLLGCAGTQPLRTFENNTFTSDLPKLCVKIHKSYIWDKGKKRDRFGEMQRDHWWWRVASKEGVGIIFDMFGHSTRLDYYYSLEQVTRNEGGIPLESVLIDEHRWLKYAYINEQKYLHTGFFTRKGDCFIYVYRYVYPAEYMDEVEKIDKTRTLTASQKELLNIVFDETDKLFTIEY